MKMFKRAKGKKPVSFKTAGALFVATLLVAATTLVTMSPKAAASSITPPPLDGRYYISADCEDHMGGELTGNICKLVTGNLESPARTDADDQTLDLNGYDIVITDNVSPVLFIHNDNVTITNSEYNPSDDPSDPANAARVSKIENLYEFGGNGILLFDSSNVVVENLYLKKDYQTGGAIILSHDENPTTKNLIKNNHIEGYSIGIEIAIATPTISENTFYHNVVTNTQAGAREKGHANIYDGNEFTVNNYGLYLENSTDTVIKNNRLYNNSTADISLGEDVTVAININNYGDTIEDEYSNPDFTAFAHSGSEMDINETLHNLSVEHTGDWLYFMIPHQNNIGLYGNVTATITRNHAAVHLNQGTQPDEEDPATIDWDPGEDVYVGVQSTDAPFDDVSVHLLGVPKTLWDKIPKDPSPIESIGKYVDVFGTTLISSGTDAAVIWENGVIKATIPIAAAGPVALLSLGKAAIQNGSDIEIWEGADTWTNTDTIANETLVSAEGNYMLTKVTINGNLKSYNVSAGHTLITTLVKADLKETDSWGAEAAIDAVTGNIAVTDKNAGVNNSGKLYIYNATTGVLIDSAVTIDAATYVDLKVNAVASHDNYVIVGADGGVPGTAAACSGEKGSGSVYLFKLIADSLEQQGADFAEADFSCGDTTGKINSVDISMNRAVFGKVTRTGGTSAATIFKINTGVLTSQLDLVENKVNWANKVALNGNTYYTAFGDSDGGVEEFGGDFDPPPGGGGVPEFSDYMIMMTIIIAIAFMAKKLPNISINPNRRA